MQNNYEITKDNNLTIFTLYDQVDSDLVSLQVTYDATEDNFTMFSPDDAVAQQEEFFLENCTAFEVLNMLTVVLGSFSEANTVVDKLQESKYVH